jgi:hypothetical protein
MVELPVGGDTSVEVSDTDVLGAVPAMTVRDSMTLSGEGHSSAARAPKACMARGASDVAAGERSSR